MIIRSQWKSFSVCKTHVRFISYILQLLFHFQEILYLYSKYNLFGIYYWNFIIKFIIFT